MNLPFSYSKYKQYKDCPIKYYYSYIHKLEVVDEQSYPLVFGTLVHLFIKLYNDKTHTEKDIYKLKDNLDELYKLITLEYLASNFNGSFECKSMDITANVSKIIKFISDNDVVFFHAIKLFKIYLNNIFIKLSTSKYYTELSFNNIIKIDDDITMCFYGSIDLLFYKEHNDTLTYFYITDFKTGKKLYPDYINQLYFYLYNILNYNITENRNILNNIDNIQVLSTMSTLLNKSPDKLSFILWQLRDNIYDKFTYDTIFDDMNNANRIMLDDIKYNIMPLHRDKGTIKLDDIVTKFDNKYKFKLREDCKSEPFVCKFCKFKESCIYITTMES